MTRDRELPGDLEVVVLDADGKVIELDPVVGAMLRLVASQREQIANQHRGDLTLHYINDSQKVYATLETHLGFLKF